MSENLKSSAHPHPSEVIDPEGRCLWCHALVERDAERKRADGLEAELEQRLLEESQRLERAEADSGVLRAALEHVHSGDCHNCWAGRACYVFTGLADAALASSAGARVAAVVAAARALRAADVDGATLETVDEEMAATAKIIMLRHELYKAVGALDRREQPEVGEPK